MKTFHECWATNVLADAGLTEINQEFEFPERSECKPEKIEGRKGFQEFMVSSRKTILSISGFTNIEWSNGEIFFIATLRLDGR
jgi:hypothetical protein